MLSTSPYIPLKTDARNPALTESHFAKHKNALFETIRDESCEKRAAGLARIWNNLSTWACLAYPAAQSRPMPGGGEDSPQDGDRPHLHRDISGEGVFDLDDEEAWSDTDLRKPKDGSVTSLRADPQAEAAPWSGGNVPYQEPGYGDYSMYGVDDAVFHPARPLEEMREILKTYLLTTLRATVDCPFADVRRFCRFILERLFLAGISVPALVCEGPSWLIPAVETVAFGHDPASEDPKQQHLRQVPMHRNGGSSRSDSFVPASFDSDTSDIVDSFASYSTDRTGDLTPTGDHTGPRPQQTGRSLEDVVFESDDSVSEAASRPSRRSSSSSSQPDTASSAIPIAGRKASRPPIDPSEIDDILLGPIGTRTKDRRARFSVDPLVAQNKENRPALSRKRTNSATYTTQQRRANRNLRAFHVGCYLSTGRVTNFGRVLSYFPRFYESTIVLHDELIRKQGGPLQRVNKLYLAIMAAAQADCQYLVSYFSKKYAQLGCNLEWLDGLEHAPRKIQRLGRINALLGRQPWKIRREHIEELLGRSQESLDNGDSSDQWTMGELVQSICTLVVVNCQAHLCLGTGVVPEPDTFGGACIRRYGAQKSAAPDNLSVDVYPLFTSSYDSGAFASPASYHNSYNGKLAHTVPRDSPCMVIPTTTNNKKGDAGTSRSTSPADSADSTDEDGETNPSLLWRRKQSFSQGRQLWAPKSESSSDGTGGEFSARSVFAQCGLVDDDDDDDDNDEEGRWNSRDGSEASRMPVNPILEPMSRFRAGTHQVPQEAFDPRPAAAAAAVLRLADCNWEDHTCSLIGRFVPDLEAVLDANLAESRVAAGDDDDGFFFPLPRTDTGTGTGAAGTGTGTSTGTGTGAVLDQGPLRDAVWFFILRLYGLYSDGYAYADVNLLLHPAAKRFLRKVCFTPEQINRADWRSIGKGLTSQERVLLTLLATHARMYACLVYAFRYCQ
ncbi:protein of unknown function [Taphrina deformans PYCC 5710]|uniref:Sestrin-1 n=1 Tax=Taphrina deformans (strain PYCC 5710 / ATCC 11124 / CBS 356.35 / IMI 108563 / JCM 9778 / NBRC 8474) TaxID=1097556 RepID=R4X9H3_TAPDE|nr:protein of unknown function [Taphrina deformans PYCC 5710]|eukprot:CCG82360.1 protein of unknown function [Taphrina deformans PYCC 5710]